MTILVDATTRVAVQGITGYQGRIETKLMLDYGTRVVAGTSPGRGGSEPVHGVPVFDTLRDAAAAHPFDASIAYVPAAAVRDAALEALAAGSKLVLVPTERVPAADAAYILAAARDAGARIVGPNTQGIIVPGVVRIGGPGGWTPEAIFAPGRVAVLSRSGGMAGELSWLLKRAGLGTSIQVHTGGEALLGTGFADLLALLEDDPDTDAAVLFGERGGTYEEQAAELVAAGGFTKPLVAFVAGWYFEDASDEVQFGHSGNILRGSAGTMATKVAALRDAGVAVAEVLPDVPELLRAALATTTTGAGRGGQR
ncbi:MAG: CoA-binding protein [Acidimicrobiia bacterium]